MEIQERFKVAVIGAGAIGGSCAAVLARAGVDVQLVVRRGEQARIINDKGLMVTGVLGDFSTPVPAVTRVEEMAPDRNLVLLAVKATDMMDIARALVPISSAPVVSLQNGLCEEALASVLGRDRVVGCVTSFGATMNSDNGFEVTSEGEFVIGNLDGPEDALSPSGKDGLAALNELLSLVHPCRISGNITGELYAKLVINACITSVGALCGLHLGEMLSQKSVRKIFCRIMGEAMAVADATGMDVAVFNGKLDYYKFRNPSGWVGDVKRHMILRIMGRKYKNLKSSSLQSLHRGRKTEIDYLTGYIVDRGRGCDIPTPVNDQVLSMVHEIEAGRREIAPENLGAIRL